KQIGLALHAYHDANKFFPPGANANNYAWSFFALPYLEQANIYKQVNPTTTLLRTAVAANTVLFQTPLPVFVCPSDIGNALNNNRPFTIAKGKTVQLSTSNYPGNGGNAGGDGIFAVNSKVKILDITDGTSNTFLVGERSTISFGFNGNTANNN